MSASNQNLSPAKKGGGAFKFGELTGEIQTPKVALEGLNFKGGISLTTP
jgi:hypothetical protein